MERIELKTFLAFGRDGVWKIGLDWGGGGSGVKDSLWLIGFLDLVKWGLCGGGVGTDGGFLRVVRGLADLSDAGNLPIFDCSIWI